MSEYLHQGIAYIVQLVGDMGYPGIFLLMTIESSFIPFPSEVVLIPAGYLVAKGSMNGLLVTLSGVSGSLLGASINYYLSKSLGRAFILRYGRYFFLSEDKFLKVERAFLRHGNFATFVGRLIFGIRQWISIPAGLSKMPFLPFAVLTSAGAAVWVVILIALGMIFGEGQEAEQMAKYIGYWLLGVVCVMVAAYAYWWVPRKGSTNPGEPVAQ